MKTIGIVVEYNPFHNGHLHHLLEANKATNADTVIAVMSGNFLQRGEPALVDKWTRTKMALDAGVDLVVELPYAFATQKAEVFSHGAIFILHHLQCEGFVFGSEDGRIQPFMETAATMNKYHQKLEQATKTFMDLGNSYPKAMTLAREEILPAGTSLDLSQPNNILGYHYIRANQKLRSPMKPYTIKRKSAHYHDEQLGEETIASATSIRKAITSQKNQLEAVSRFLPSTTLRHLEEYLSKYHQFHTWETYWPFLRYRLISATPHELRNIYEITEGIEHRLMEGARKANTFLNFMDLVKTKRYTWTRIQRMLLHILTNTSKEVMLNQCQNPEFIRILGMNAKGQRHIKKIKKETNLPLISNAASNKELLSLDIKATEIYAQGLPSVISTSLLHSEYKQPPIIRKDE
ncbi:MAG TPA: nucleotidyltransferase [Chondromyces sp.]|nr:nucleotidyltransferase [Chondromyces sp.]